jgi:hypothetical protein
MILSRRRSLRRSKVALILSVDAEAPSLAAISEAEIMSTTVLTTVAAISSPESDVEVQVAFSREKGLSSRQSVVSRVALDLSGEVESLEVLAIKG